jgi:hypothetical protein
MITIPDEKIGDKLDANPVKTLTDKCEPMIHKRKFDNVLDDNQELGTK